MLLLGTKKVHSPFQKNLRLQKDVAMRSPLGPVLHGIFMVHLEQTLMPKLEKFITTLKRRVDDTITYIKPDSIMEVIKVLHKLPENTKFSY